LVSEGAGASADTPAEDTDETCFIEYQPMHRNLAAHLRAGIETSWMFQDAMGTVVKRGPVDFHRKSKAQQCPKGIAKSDR